VKEKWYEANINLARTKSIKKKWYEANVKIAREKQKDK
jgi:hypothetical protein